MTSSNNSANSLIKWVLTAIGSVIIAVAIWWLTRESGPLSPKPEANVSILGFPSYITINVENMDTLRSMKTRYDVEVYNSGKAPAEQCYVRWKFPPDWDLRVTDYFGVAPEDKRTITLDLYSLQQTIISEGIPWPSNQRYALQTEARLICDDAIHAVYQSTLSVFPQTSP